MILIDLLLSFYFLNILKLIKMNKNKDVVKETINHHQIIRKFLSLFWGFIMLQVKFLFEFLSYKYYTNKIF